MKRIQRPERDRGKIYQKIASAYSVPIFQGMYLDKSLRDIVFEGCCRSALCSGIDVAIATTAAQKATTRPS